MTRARLEGLYGTLLPTDEVMIDATRNWGVAGSLAFREAGG
jgi:hypothetical protein